MKLFVKLSLLGGVLSQTDSSVTSTTKVTTSTVTSLPSTTVIETTSTTTTVATTTTTRVIIGEAAGEELFEACEKKYVSEKSEIFYINT